MNVKGTFEYYKGKINKKIYFISDTHFNHRNIIKYCNRLFKDIEEMKSALIENWNKTINDYDIVFYLGDVALTNESEIKEIILKLKGKKILIRGNHDKKSKEFFRSVGFEIIPDNLLKLDKEKLILSHKPLSDTEIPEEYTNSEGNLSIEKLMNIIIQEDEIPYYSYQIDSWTMSAEEKYGYRFAKDTGLLGVLKQHGIEGYFDFESYGRDAEMSVLELCYYILRILAGIILLFLLYSSND